MPKSEEMDDILVNSKTLENLFGVKDRTVRYLADQGIVSRDSKGKYFLLKSAKGYITMLKAQASGKMVQIDGEELNLDAERAAHEKVKREIDEIKLALIKGKVHKAEDVERVVTDMLTRFRSHMEALPSSVARKLENKKRADVQRILTAEVSRALNELSDYKPSDYYSDEHIDITDEDLKALGVDASGGTE